MSWIGGHDVLAGREGFANHLRIAYGSAIETEEILELARERNILPDQMARETIEHCLRSLRLLLGLIKRYRRPP